MAPKPRAYFATQSEKLDQDFVATFTMILYGIASETSIGRLFLAGALPGLLLTGFFIAWALYLSWRRGTLASSARHYSLAEQLAVVPRVLPFVLVIVGAVYALYGGIATPSEAAGVGAALCLLLVVLVYGLWRPGDLWPILRDTLRESVMILMIIGPSILFGYMLTSLMLCMVVAMVILCIFPGIATWLPTALMGGAL